MHTPNLRSYIIGFVSSIVLTLAAFSFVWEHVNSDHGSLHVFVTSWIVGLAVIQLVVQLVFFLHLGEESKPRWNLTVFSFMLLVLIILVFGSLWIMNNLDYHMMHDKNVENYIIHDEGIEH